MAEAAFYLAHPSSTFKSSSLLLCSIHADMLFTWHEFNSNTYGWHVGYTHPFVINYLHWLVSLLIEPWFNVHQRSACQPSLFKQYASHIICLCILRSDGIGTFCLKISFNILKYTWKDGYTGVKSSPRVGGAELSVRCFLCKIIIVRRSWGFWFVG